MSDPPVTAHAEHHDGAVELRKEAYTMALYVAVCLLAALIALPESGVGVHVAGIIWGVTIGLAVAHWFAFRVSARLVGAGRVRQHDVESAGAQLAGAATVAIIASIPVLLSAEDAERQVVELVLAGFIAAVGFAVARGSVPAEPERRSTRFRFLSSRSGLRC